MESKYHFPQLNVVYVSLILATFVIGSLDVQTIPPQHRGSVLRQARHLQGQTMTVTYDSHKYVHKLFQFNCFLIETQQFGVNFRQGEKFEGIKGLKQQVAKLSLYTLISIRLGFSLPPALTGGGCAYVFSSEHPPCHIVVHPPPFVTLLHSSAS